MCYDNYLHFLNKEARHPVWSKVTHHTDDFFVHYIKQQFLLASLAAKLLAIASEKLAN